MMRVNKGEKEPPPFLPSQCFLPAEKRGFSRVNDTLQLTLIFYCQEMRKWGFAFAISDRMIIRWCSASPKPSRHAIFTCVLKVNASICSAVNAMMVAWWRSWWYMLCIVLVFGLSISVTTLIGWREFRGKLPVFRFIENVMEILKIGRIILKDLLNAIWWSWRMSLTSNGWFLVSSYLTDFSLIHLVPWWTEAV